MPMNTKANTYIAHIGNNGSIQSVKEHCANTSDLCKEFAIDALKECAAMTGLLHDAGKYRISFQKRIKGDNREKVEHSIVGAQMLGKPNDPLTLMAQLCIAGHHSGIPNCGNTTDLPYESSLYGRMKRKVDDMDDEQWKTDFSICGFSDEQKKHFLDYLLHDCIAEGAVSKEEFVEKYAFLTRYLFSCLTDADTKDTIMATGGDVDRSLLSNLPNCMELLKQKLKVLGDGSETPLQKARTSLQRQAFMNIEKDAEIYLMNMPTGSGKTLAGMYCALKRALKSGKKRIIYVIPYNSIIEQTAEVFESLFGNNANILRHQSTYSFEEDADDEDDLNKNKVKKYACENWDSSIILTTAVQFFETVYSNKRGKLRKLHNMGDSVLVFDEAHLMPVDKLQPCLRAISYITKYLNSEALFLTATMPDFGILIKKYSLKTSIIKELIPDKSDFSYFKKCSFENIGKASDEKILLRATESPSSLIIVNSRKSAREFYNNLKSTGCQAYHLSTYMTAYDRTRVIEEIRHKLNELNSDYPDGKDVPRNRQISVVSTSLIEAGVDMDFHTVFRELSGLDSILQAAGRCNREGKRDTAITFIFEREQRIYTDELGAKINITRSLIEEYPKKLTDPDVIKEYYRRLHSFLSSKIVSASISNDCKDVTMLPFADYSLIMIDTKTESIAIARNEESEKLIEDLKNGFPHARKLQKYCFSVYSNELAYLIEAHLVNDYGSGIFCLTDPDYYDSKTGVKFEGSDIYV